ENYEKRCYEDDRKGLLELIKERYSSSSSRIIKITSDDHHSYDHLLTIPETRYEKDCYITNTTTVVAIAVTITTTNFVWLPLARSIHGSLESV
ncbi:hypothetical protein V1478_011562, partial [Vespula squamosa]